MTRLSGYLLPTEKQAPADAEALSHKLLVRAGMVRQVGAGLWTWMPAGWRVQQKIVQIIREEMNAIGSGELLMPVLQPAELWRRSGRYRIPELFKLNDRRGADMVLAMTHEECLTFHISSIVRSYRDLPLFLYHFQTKERDEPRPRAGVLRTREFIMKDAYTFDRDPEGLDASYQKHFGAYERIFDRLGLDWYSVESDVGMMGGFGAHEFMAPCAAGEDEVALAPGYAANVEIASAEPQPVELPPAQAEEFEDRIGPAGYIGPVGADVPILLDEGVAAGSYVTGANRPDAHLRGVEPGRDFRFERVDIRTVEAGDTVNGHAIRIESVIEAGNIFKLGTRFSEPLGATYLDESGSEQLIWMGSYGLGPARIAAAAAEQFADEQGISWPRSIAPFDVELVGLGKDGTDERDLAERLYGELRKTGLDVLYDDRDAGPGTKFADAELLGVPLRLTVGRRTLEAGEIEAQVRRGREQRSVPLEDAAGAAAELWRSLP